VRVPPALVFSGLTPRRPNLQNPVADLPGAARLLVATSLERAISFCAACFGQPKAASVERCVFPIEFSVAGNAGTVYGKS
jgi:hypothetical protein